MESRYGQLVPSDLKTQKKPQELKQQIEQNAPITSTFRHNSRLFETSRSDLSILSSLKSRSFFVFDQQEEISVLRGKNNVIVWLI
jgi:hypothetical protein